MLCSSCKKNQATVVASLTTDGKKQTGYFCSDCYRRLFVNGELQKKVSLDECPHCKTTKKEFLSTSIVGCEKCYETLVEPIGKALEKMQGAGKVHVGKKPKDGMKNKGLEERAQLKKEVELRMRRHDFSSAEEYFKRLKTLDKGQGENG